jgi:hypothetical protein
VETETFATLAISSRVTVTGEVSFDKTKQTFADYFILSANGCLVNNLVLF